MAGTCKVCGREQGSKVPADLRIEGKATCPICAAEWPIPTPFKTEKVEPPHDRYMDVPVKPDSGTCQCPECCEARGEPVTDEMRKRHQRAMNKRLETK